MNLAFPFSSFSRFRKNIQSKRRMRTSTQIRNTIPLGTMMSSFPKDLQYSKHNINFSNPAESASNNKKVEEDVSKVTAEKVTEDRTFFDIFGIRLYYDDILLISLIFFLYNEGIEDTGLFITLILLLLN